LKFVPRQRHWMIGAFIPVPLTRHKTKKPGDQGLLAKSARTPGYRLSPLTRRMPF
jgi:hypothetical protein